MRRGLAVALALSAIGLQRTAGSEPSTVQRLVTVDVIAADARGRIVDDLKPGDFELREEGAPLTLESVRLVRAATGPQTDAAALIRTASDERQAAVKEDARLFAIFLDEYHVTRGANADRVREALVRFLDRDVTP